MTEKITLDQFNFELTNHKLEDLKKKMDIVHNVIKQCEQEAKIGQKPIERSSGTLAKCSKLTGVSLNTLLTINTLEQKTKQFKLWLLEQKQLTLNYDQEYSNIRKYLIDSYMKELKIPTKLAGKTAYEGFNNNFTLMQLPGTKSSIIVEKPEIVQERRKFLYTKMMYREAKKNIVYIGKVNILIRKRKIIYKEDNIEERNRFIIAVSPIFGQIGYKYSCGHSQEYDIANWIEEKIMPELPKESVVILQENALNDTHGIIDSLSTKEQMINWLQSNDVNHDPKMHRADLFKLINIFKKSCEELSQAEQILRAHGHIVMRKKKCNLNINYFDPFWDFFIEELSTKPLKGLTTEMKVILQTITLDYWQNLENVLLVKEQLMYKEDLEMEDMIDKLVTMVKYEGLPKDVKFNEYCKRMEQPPIYLHISVRHLYDILNYKGLNITIIQ